MRSFGTGFICLWSGAIVDIPTGWALCDGTQGTPDLRDEFIIGAGNTYNVEDSGGTAAGSHTFTSEPHSHLMSPGGDVAGGAGRIYPTTQSTASGTTEPKDDRPPWYSLAYIMEL